MDKILFFGYGANRSKSKIAQITGEEIEGEVGAIMENYKLAFQSLDQIPNPARDELERIWGSDFKCYTGVEGEGIISGLIWSLTEESFEKLKEWEYIGTWRELIEVSVKTSDGRSIKVFTDKAPSNHPVKGYVDGLNYDEFAFRNVELEGKIEKEKYYTEEKLNQIRASIASLHA